MDDLVQDIRYGLRNLVRRPAFTAAAVVTLALGIGANTAIFSIINAMFLRPYPYYEPDQLMVVQSKSRASGQVSPLDYLDYRERNRVFSDLGAVVVDTFNLSTPDEPIRIKGGRASASLFATLDGPTIAGRTFLPEEDQPGASDVVILSERLWRRNFASDPDVVGESVQIDGRPFAVVGVVPPESQFPDTDAAELFVPLALDRATADRARRSLFVLGRLKEGVTAELARSTMAGIGDQLASEYPETNQGWSIEVSSLREFRTAFANRVVGGTGGQIFLLLASVVGFVLLLACSNVANLLLQKSSARQREFAVRSALGAGHGRLIQQLLTESVILAMIGGVVGVLFARWLLQLVVLKIPRELPSYLNDFQLDLRALAFMLAISLVTAIIFGLAPISTALKAKLQLALSESGARTSGAKGGRMRAVLVAIEVALSVILLIGADLLITSFRQLQNVDPGFQRENVLTLQIELPVRDYPETFHRVGFIEDVLDDIRALPGVEASAIGTNPLVGGWSTATLEIEHQSEAERRTNPRIGFQLVTGDYFQVTGIPLLTGRELTARDRPDSKPVCVVSKSFARYFWPGEDPVGKRLRIDATRDDRWLEVVGMAGETKRLGLDASSGLELYVPYQQLPWGRTLFYVRTQVPPLSISDAVRRAIRSKDPRLPISEVKSLEKMVDDSLWLQDITSLLVSAFAIVALAIATVGLYGSMSYSATMRSREIGIRMAMGARGLDIVRLVVGQGMKVGAFGMFIGLVGAAVLARYLDNILFEVSARNPRTFVEISLLILTITLIANLIPARRAAGIDPVVVMRYE